jgi:hypothetical protein
MFTNLAPETQAMLSRGSSIVAYQDSLVEALMMGTLQCQPTGRPVNKHSDYEKTTMALNRNIMYT